MSDSPPGKPALDGGVEGNSQDPSPSNDSSLNYPSLINHLRRLLRNLSGEQQVSGRYDNGPANHEVGSGPGSEQATHHGEGTGRSVSSHPSDSASDKFENSYGFERIFQGRRIFVVTKAQAMISDDVDKMLGITDKTFDWLDSQEETVVSDYNRQAKFPTWSQMTHDLRINTCVKAAQHRQTMIHRDTPYHDPTYASIRASDASNATEWYNAIIDLTQMEECMSSIPAQRFTKSHFDKRTRENIPHYDTRALSGIYFIIMDVVEDAQQNGFIQSTNQRQNRVMQQKGLATNMSAAERIRQIKMCLQVRKSTVFDLLGPYAKDNVRDLVYCPLAYLAVKRGDHKTNEGRKKSEQDRKAAHLQRKEYMKNMSQEEKKAALDTWPHPWSETPANERKPCLYPSWQALDATKKIADAQAARNYFASLEVRDAIPRTPDPQLQHVNQVKHLVARWFYNCLVNVTDIQDNATSYGYQTFVGQINSTVPAQLRLHHEQIKNMQAWAYLLADRHVDDAIRGRLVPRGDGAVEAELFVRSGRQALLGSVLHGDKNAPVNVFERIGATGVVLMREKAHAAAFLGVRESDIRFTELVYEPLAFMKTKVAHRRSNAVRKRKHETKDRKDDDDDGPDDGPGGDSGGFSTMQGQGRRKRKCEGDGTDGSGAAGLSSKKSRRGDSVMDTQKDVGDSTMTYGNLGITANFDPTTPSSADIPRTLPLLQQHSGSADSPTAYADIFQADTMEHLANQPVNPGFSGHMIEPRVPTKTATPNFSKFALNASTPPFKDVNSEAQQNPSFSSPYAPQADHAELALPPGGNKLIGNHLADEDIDMDEFLGTAAQIGSFPFEPSQQLCVSPAPARRQLSPNWISGRDNSGNPFPQHDNYFSQPQKSGPETIGSVQVQAPHSGSPILAAPETVGDAVGHRFEMLHPTHMQQPGNGTPERPEQRFEAGNSNATHNAFKVQNQASTDSLVKGLQVCAESYSSPPELNTFAVLPSAYNQHQMQGNVVQHYTSTQNYHYYINSHQG